MASSGTTTFDLAIDEIIEEAYERCGIQTNSGYDLAKARRSLNVLFSDWGNRGVHLFKIQLNAVMGYAKSKFAKKILKVKAK